MPQSPPAHFSTSAFPCQIALQGGGAKIIALLAAMEGVQEMQRAGRIRVTRISGTSAGAIVAAMFAAGIEMGAARKKAASLVASSAASDFPPPSSMRLIWQVLARGTPLWKEARLAEHLQMFFAEAKVKTLGDLFRKSNTHVHVVASVLSDARKIAYSDEADPDKPIVAALLDSAAIPFCFRVWQKSGPVIVDGGLCDNLPAEELLPHEAADGPVLALSFDTKWPGTQRNVREFSLALLETAMGNSVARSRARVGHERVHEIVTSLTTFDMVGAAAFSDDEAKGIASETKEFVARFIKDARSIGGDPWSDLSPVVLEDWWRVFQSQHKDRIDAVNLHTAVVVQANSMAEPNDPHFGLPDSVSYRIKFQPIAEMQCCLVSMVPSEGSVSLYGSEVDLVTDQAGPVDHVVIPVRDPSFPSKRPAVVFFTPPLQANTGPYLLRVTQSVPNFMAALRQGRDELFVRTRPSPEPVRKVELCA